MVDIIVFGSDKGAHQHEGCCCGCGHGHYMQEAAGVLAKALTEKFGDQVRFRYVDVFSEDIMNFPEVVKVMNQYRLPLTVLNGEPRFHGGLSIEKISGAVAELLGIAGESGSSEQAE